MHIDKFFDVRRTYDISVAWWLQLLIHYCRLS